MTRHEKAEEGEHNMRCHKDLDVWKLSMELVTEIYELTREFPEHEIYGLSSQLRRAAVSIPSNIAEGAARNTDKDFLRFVYIASGSLAEVETQLQIAANLEYLDDLTDVPPQLDRIRKMLVGLAKRLGS